MNRVMVIVEGLITYFSIGFTAAFLVSLWFDPAGDLEASLWTGGAGAVFRLLLFVFGVKIGAELRND